MKFAASPEPLFNIVRDIPGSYDSVNDLEYAIYDYLLQHNAKPKPFVWSKTAEDILTRERRALDALDHVRGNR